MGRFNKSLSYNKLSTIDFLTKTAVTVDQQLTYSGLLFFGKQDSILEHFPDFRIDLLEIPGTSYSDATVNMLMHADYFSPAKSRVRIFTNHIEFFNPGGLPKSLKLLMETDISIPRNKTIAKLFRLVKLAENAGFGFDRMNKGWRSFSNSLPEYLAEKDFFAVKFFFNPNVNQPDNETINKTNKTIYDTEGTTKHMEEYVKILLGLMKDNPRISIRQLEKETELSKSGVEWRINLLKKKGILKRTGSIKSGKWEILQHTDFLWSGENLREDIPNTRTKTKKTVEKSLEKGLEKTVEKILQLMHENPSITMNQLSEETGLTRRGIEWNIKKLKKEGKLERIGPDRGGYWKVNMNKN